MSQSTEMIPAGATLTASGAGAGNISVDGSVIININGKDYTLRGTVGTNLIVKYESEFPDGANIGTILEIVDSVAHALGADGLAQKVKDTVTELQNNTPPILAEVVKVLTTSPVQITYLEINTATHTYGFGFALDFRGQNIKAGDIQLNAFALKVTYVKPAS